jgi:hypothetical protein
MQTAPTPDTGTTSAAAAQPSHPRRTIDNDGVRIFLHAANEADAHSAVLAAMRSRRKDKGTAEADALWEGSWSLKKDADEAIKEVRNRGGLLHFRRARIDYTDGKYVVRGAAQ